MKADRAKTVREEGVEKAKAGLGEVGAGEVGAGEDLDL